ncbi:unnamed protein product [Protopolystoma xenopodis]|uniref:EGF-like domain-containing protein n=1 Tax=Protopolystoma xenopodis TaxID=117903 RepID=A0A448XID5_9PLAT|nr:unnamed protein product [Protopolystoma xenopodis]
MGESSAHLHPKRGRVSRGLRQAELRSNAKRLQYSEIQPSSSGPRSNTIFFAKKPSCSDVCIGVTCSNNGVCSGARGYPTCNCRGNYGGSRCETGPGAVGCCNLQGGLVKTPSEQPQLAEGTWLSRQAKPLLAHTKWTSRGHGNRRGATFWRR